MSQGKINHKAQVKMPSVLWSSAEADGRLHFRETLVPWIWCCCCLWRARDECDSCHMHIKRLGFRHPAEWWDLKWSSSVSLINLLSCLEKDSQWWTHPTLTNRLLKYWRCVRLIQFKWEWKVSWCAWVNNSKSFEKKLTDRTECAGNLEDINYLQTQEKNFSVDDDTLIYSCHWHLSNNRYFGKVQMPSQIHLCLCWVVFHGAEWRWSR